MKIAKDFMTRDLTSVTEEAPLREVAELLSLHALSGVPVVNKENIVIGFISEKDIVTSIFPEKLRLENPDMIGFHNLSQLVKKLSLVGQALVKDYMSKEVHTVSEEATLADVAEIMLQKDLQRVPVTRHKRLVGIADRSTISSILLEEGSL
ncbi:hypothetical protein COT42_07000 [Candidatus Saganbacteria bacterium CG08_land_8_20_14_0_20_45_16]|uniref:CBS domain-containing protein n=1 Tax=Candidatus Saganbacteria bacterium CG08_land_8_20_14_0_20_45_16 TaxID=2014293 RepID=A0A2H0XV55_UNCSA|nr:MAG: hypothetical protein COT42_07000 [Candidatus Saganbacteria bacterium CG08_land_8_20_14_0_20_45_16]